MGAISLGISRALENWDPANRPLLTKGEGVEELHHVVVMPVHARI